MNNKYADSKYIEKMGEYYENINNQLLDLKTFKVTNKEDLLNMMFNLESLADELESNFEQFSLEDSQLYRNIIDFCGEIGEMLENLLDYSNDELVKEFNSIKDEEMNYSSLEAFSA